MQIPVTAQFDTPVTGSPSRRREPVTFGVPLRQGTVRSVDGWSIAVQGNAVGDPVQARALDRWPDGSIRWMLIDAQIDLAHVPATLVLDDEGPAASDARILRFDAHPDGAVIVDTGAARFEMRPGGTLPFQRVVPAGFQHAILSHVSVADERGAQLACVIDRVQVEQQGWLRGVVRADGRVLAGDRTILLLTTRVHFFANSATTRVLLCATNPDAATHPGGFWDLGDPRSVLLRDLSIVLSPSGSSSRVHASAERCAEWRSFDLPFEVYQDSSGGEHWQSPNHINRLRQIPNTFRGYRLRTGETLETGLRASPAAVVEFGPLQVGVAVPYFWQNFPRAIAVSDTALRVGLWPAEYADAHEIQPGEQKTHELFLSFAPDGVTERPLDWVRNRSIIALDPAYCIATRAVPFLAALPSEHAELVSVAVDGDDTFERKREVIDEFGWRHFGEIYGDHESVRQKSPPIVSHYNNQYDPIAGFICQFLRTGDLRWWRLATELAAHVVDVDVYHTKADKWAYNHGLFWHTYHYGDADTATHRTYPKSADGRIHGGGPSADHNYTTGLMLHYFMTGDEASRQTVIDLGRFVIDMDDGRKTVLKWIDRGDTGRAALSATGYFGPGRGPANSLNALIDAHRVSGDEPFLTKAESLIRRVIHPAEDIAIRQLDVPELRWFYTMFLQSLGKYLQYKAEHGQLDRMYAYARNSLLHYARWMAQYERPYLEAPDKLEFVTETWPAQDIRKSDVFYYAALHAVPEERACFVERATFFHDYSVRTLAGMSTRTLARPVVVLLTSGFMHAWFRADPDVAAPPAPESDHGAPELFIPQIVRAKRRLIALASAGGAALAALATLWFLV
jgi:hypothetical protein